MKIYKTVKIEEEDFDKIKQEMTDEKAIDILERLPEGWFPYRLPSFAGGANEHDLEQFEVCCAIWRAIDKLKER